MNFDILSDKELVIMSLKYKLIEKKDIPKTTRKQLLQFIKAFLHRKFKQKDKEDTLYQVTFKSKQ